MRTEPVNHSAGPLLEGCVPIRLISMLNSCLLPDALDFADPFRPTNEW
jgi:hypothetical protein